jgi:alpha-glucoside transport system permease protein
VSVEAQEIIPLPLTSRESVPEAARRRLSSPWATAVVVLITVVWTIPTVGLLVTSLRPVYLTKSSGWWAALSDRTFTLDNYAQVLSGGETIPGGITPYLFNTVAIAVPATIVPILLASMVAYALAWIPFRGAAVVYIVVVSLQVLPLQMALLPLLEMFSNGWSLGPIPVFPNLDEPDSRNSALMGTYVPLWLAHTAFALPLAVFIMHNAIIRLPRELLDAARIDGASHYVIFRRLILPLSVPAMASIAIFQFLWVWNDLLVALTFAGGTPDVAPITPYIANLQGGYGVYEHLVTAAAFVAIAVPIAVFFLLQRYFVRGLIAGAVEG